jgi:predicted PhzF superfamily epimerase YddE/YHI9
VKGPFAFVDVFTETPLAGNPLATVPYAPKLEQDDFVSRIQAGDDH